MRGRTKMRIAYVNGKTLSISGGNYALCDGSAWACCGKNAASAKDMVTIIRTMDSNVEAKISLSLYRKWK